MDSGKRNALIVVSVIALVGIVAFAVSRMPEEKKYEEGKSYMQVVGKQLAKEKKAEFWNTANPEEAIVKIETQLKAAVAEGKITEEQAEKKREFVRQGFAKKKAGAKKQAGAKATKQ